MNNAIITTLMVIVIAVPLFFDNSLYGCFDLSKITVLYFLVSIALGLWCVKVITSSETPSTFKLPVLGLPVTCILLTTALSTVFSVSPYMSLVGTHKRYGGFVSAVVYALLFFMIVRFVRRKHIESFINVIIMTAVIAAVFGLSQSYGPADQYKTMFNWDTDFGYGGRIASTFGHPAFFSAFVVMTVPLVLSRMLDGCRKNTALFLYLSVLAVLLFAFYQTKTRASFVGLVVSICFFCFMARAQIFSIKRIKIIAIVAVFGIAACCFSINNKNSLLNRFLIDVRGGKVSGTSLERLVQYKTGLGIIRDYPVFGIGPDVLALIYPRYYVHTDRMRFTNQNRVHNAVLDTVISTGLLGLCAYAYFALAYIRMMWRTRLGNITLVGLNSGIIAYFVQNQFSFGHVPIIMLFWVMLGLSVVECGGEHDRKNTEYDM